MRRKRGEKKDKKMEPGMRLIEKVIKSIPSLNLFGF